MHGKTKDKPFISELYIHQESYDQIKMWAMSKNEINFICFGYGKVIENVYRLSNISRLPESYSCWNSKEMKLLVKEKKKLHQTVLAYGHSHPKKSHEKHPSLIDIKYIKLGSIELIAFPLLDEVGAWKIFKSINKTLSSEIQIIVV